MEIETLKRSHLKRNIIIGVILIAVISAVILNFTRAKYRVTESIPLVNGTINYSLADLNIVGLYIDGEEATELDSSKTYILDTTQSTCTYKDGTEIADLNISYESETGNLTITPFTTKGTKCTLYFNEQVSVKDTLLANYPTVLTRNDFSTVITNTTTGTIYKSLDESQYDNDGEVYYFAGNPTDNWLKFAGYYWRIIRINGDGTIRVIYSGNGSAQTVGSETQIGTSVFNSPTDNNAYVGFKYTINDVHGTTTNSTILTILNSWFASNLSNFIKYIDVNVGFCGDRTPSTSESLINNSGGIGTTTTYYAGYIRLFANKTPVYSCNNASDLYTVNSSNRGNKSLTYPIGLITADEVAYAGSVHGLNNTYFYLFNNDNFWTMSPYLYRSSGAYVFALFLNGSIGYQYDYGNLYVGYSYGVRPVINLKADVTISGSGTTSDPYVIS